MKVVKLVVGCAAFGVVMALRQEATGLLVRAAIGGVAGLILAWTLMTAMRAR